MKKLSVVFSVIIFILSFGYVHFANVKNDISSSVVRFHIIANSDSISDQQTKLLIRDKVLNKYAFNCASKEEFKDYVINNSEGIKKDVDCWLKENNKDYSCKVSLGKASFPTKNYGNLSLPKGEYEAFKITLGEGMGHNWWCVMFPPLCFVDSATGKIDSFGENYLKENLSKEEYSIITSENCIFRLKLLEIADFVQKAQ